MPATKELNGTWMSRFYCTDLKGNKTQKKKRGFLTKKEALEYEREFLAKSTSETSMTFKSLYELYIEDLTARIRENTLITKKYIIELKILPFFQKLKINSITPITIRKWQNELLISVSRVTGEKYSSTYIKTINNQLVAIFNYAVKFHSLAENPCHKAGSIGKKNADEMSIWTIDDFNKFSLLLVHKPINYTGFNILFWCGIRIGELLALTLKDIDLEKNIIYINKSYQRIKGRDIITPPKTPKSNRTIDIPDVLSTILKDYISTLYKPTENTRIIPATKHLFEHDIKLYSSKANIKKIRVHDLRHSHASFLIHLGISPLLISQRLGHEKIETTLNTYSHLYPQATTLMMNSINSHK